jgi:biopolymer transport protein ExbD
MKFRRRSRLHSEVSTSSLNDIMFFLLLFFLIVSTMVNPAVIKLTLPRAQGEQTVSKKMVTVSISKDKKYFIDADASPVSFDQIEPILTEKLKNIDDPTVVLRVDNSLTIQDVIDVIQIGSKLKIKMILATQPK